MLAMLSEMPDGVLLQISCEAGNVVDSNSITEHAVFVHDNCATACNKAALLANHGQLYVLCRVAVIVRQRYSPEVQ